MRPGARPIDPTLGVLVSPCDAIVGAHGHVDGTRVFQAKGFPYRLEELLGDPALVERYRDGVYVTLRLKASFYHRFHAPCDAAVRRVVYISGDTWMMSVSGACLCAMSSSCFVNLRFSPSSSSHRFRVLTNRSTSCSTS